MAIFGFTSRVRARTAAMTHWYRPDERTTNSGSRRSPPLARQFWASGSRFRNGRGDRSATLADVANHSDRQFGRGFMDEMPTRSCRRNISAPVFRDQITGGALRVSLQDGTPRPRRMGIRSGLEVAGCHISKLDGERRLSSGGAPLTTKWWRRCSYPVPAEGATWVKYRGGHSRQAVSRGPRSRSTAVHQYPAHAALTQMNSHERFGNHPVVCVPQPFISAVARPAPLAKHERERHLGNDEAHRRTRP